MRRGMLREMLRVRSVLTARRLVKLGQLRHVCIGNVRNCSW